MCTSIAWNNGGFFFGRNLDLEVDFGQRVVITPRRQRQVFRKEDAMELHYAMIGMATVMEGCALYADAMNEKGLCVAGLNFPENAYYPAEWDGREHCISPFELPWWVLGQCATVQEARTLLERTKIVGIPFSGDVPISPLHWHIADGQTSIVLECMREGMRIHVNPVGVLTNNPPFEFHLNNLRQYMNLTPLCPENRFSDKLELSPFGRGMGAIGLPGDASPASRFVRAAFLTHNAICDAQDSVGQFFHLLDSVAMTRGSVIAPGDKWEQTLYSCCMDVDEGVYYYKTYTNNQLTAVHLRNANLDGEALLEFPLEMKQHILHVN
ncbi:MAG: choloylglycine hydrolase family protein [Clostridiales bacterium]|nr:choloylglycine hydrolase family protein [Clostridiales bacterium]